MNPRTKAIYLLLALVPVYGWLPTSRRYGHQRRTLVTRWVDTKDKTTQDAGQDANPCWEELYDDDCVMENAAAASFIAAKWIKSLPCGEGVQDCDMPDDLTAPETRPEAGIDHVDVMDLLGLKRAKPVNSSSNGPAP